MDTKREHRTHAEGSPRGKPCDLSYSPSGRLIGRYRDNNSVTLSATVDMAYGYCDDYQPHAVKRMFDYKNGMLYDMRWDEEKSSGLFDSVAENKSAGNLGQVSMAMPGEMVESSRFLFWTEDSAVQSERRTNSFVFPSQNSVGVANWMHTAVDDRCYSYYTYDHSGERRLKLTDANNLLDVNADYMSTISLLDRPTLYPSAYMVLTNRGYTNVAKVERRASLLALPRRSNVTERKHYYAGTERVAARLGGGGLDALYHAIGNDEELQVKADMLFDQSLEQVNNRVLNENNLDCIGQCDFARPEQTYHIYDIPYQIKAEVEFDYSQLNEMMNDILVDHGHGKEPDVYFYHSDHLGSASWITDNNGDAVQHLQYLPYGEPYINQRLSGYNERFTFTGKEKDSETGFGYFGARYMDHELMTMWLSVDPMADKYLGISPYAYCAWNPVKLVDPDGRDVWSLSDDGTMTWEKVSKHDVIKYNGKAITLQNSNNVFGSGRDGYSFSLKDNPYYTFTDVMDAQKAFEFFADNLNYEFSALGYIDGGRKRYDLSTSQSEVGDINGSTRAAELEDKLRKHFHNHPNDIAEPSVSTNAKGQGNDKDFSNLIRQKSPSCKFYLYTKVGGGGYQSYSFEGGEMKMFDDRQSSFLKSSRNYARKQGSILNVFSF